MEQRSRYAIIKVTAPRATAAVTTPEPLDVGVRPC